MPIPFPPKSSRHSTDSGLSDLTPEYWDKRWGDTSTISTSGNTAADSKKLSVEGDNLSLLSGTTAAKDSVHAGTRSIGSGRQYSGLGSRLWSLLNPFQSSRRDGSAKTTVTNSAHENADGAVNAPPAYYGLTIAEMEKEKQGMCSPSIKLEFMLDDTDKQLNVEKDMKIDIDSSTKHVLIRASFKKAGRQDEHNVKIDLQAAMAAQLPHGCQVNDYGWDLYVDSCPILPSKIRLMRSDWDGEVFSVTFGGEGSFYWYAFNRWEVTLRWWGKSHPDSAKNSRASNSLHDAALFRAVIIKGEDGDPKLSIQRPEGKDSLLFCEVTTGGSASA